MELLINSEISLEKWNEIFSISGFSTPFQSPSFYKLFNSVPGITADVFAVEADSEIKALCVITLQKEKGIKGFFSRRAIIYGGPLIRDNSPEYFRFLLNSIVRKFRQRAIYVEIRNLHDYNIFRGSL